MCNALHLLICQDWTACVDFGYLYQCEPKTLGVSYIGSVSHYWGHHYKFFVGSHKANKRMHFNR